MKPAPSLRLALTPMQALWALLIGLTALHMTAAAISPLTEDEAYYRLWSQHLQWGYYDHPPMIAAWIAAGRFLAGDTALGVRLLPCLSLLAISGLIYDLMRQLGAARRAAGLAAIFWHATLLISLSGGIAAPDGPAALFWLATLCAAVRAVKPGGERWWLAAGVCGGLAALSKYSALFLGPGVGLWIWFCTPRDKVLRSPWLWAGAVLAILTFSPNVLWNAGHHWASFAKQFGRIGPSKHGKFGLPALILSQIVLFNPLILALAGRALVLSGGKFRIGQTATGLLSLSCAPFLAYLFIHSLHDTVQAHWPAPLYPSIAGLAALAALAPATKPFWPRLGRLAAPIGLAVGLLVGTAVVTGPPLAPAGADPLAIERNWPGFAGKLEALRQRQGAAWVATLSYGSYAMLSTTTAVKAPVFEADERDRYVYLPQDPAWRAALTEPGLIVDLKRRLDGMNLHDCFDTVRPLGEVQRGPSLNRKTAYGVYWVQGPKRDLIGTGCGLAKRSD